MVILYSITITTNGSGGGTGDEGQRWRTSTMAATWAHVQNVALYIFIRLYLHYTDFPCRDLKNLKFKWGFWTFSLLVLRCLTWINEWKIDALACGYSVCTIYTSFSIRAQWFRCNRNLCRTKKLWKMCICHSNCILCSDCGASARIPIEWVRPTRADLYKILSEFRLAPIAPTNFGEGRYFHVCHKYASTTFGNVPSIFWCAN